MIVIVHVGYMHKQNQYRFDKNGRLAILERKYQDIKSQFKKKKTAHTIITFRGKMDTCTKERRQEKSFSFEKKFEHFVLPALVRHKLTSVEQGFRAISPVTSR